MHLMTQGFLKSNTYRQNDIKLSPRLVFFRMVLFCPYGAAFVLYSSMAKGHWRVYVFKEAAERQSHP